MTTQTLYLGGERAIPGLQHVASGKVRDIYAAGERHLVFVTTDRVSAFDVVMKEGVPHKGQVLTAVAAWWFEHTRDVVGNHLVSTAVEDLEGLDGEWRERLRGRVMLVRKARATSVEWVVRGYLAGSGWKEYQTERSVCGIELPEGLSLASRLPQPILTPTTKDTHHDLPLSPAEARERVGDEIFECAEGAALRLFRRGSDVLAKIGILLADTKFEFGHVDGRLILIDEALTPDSSRFWPASEWRPSSSPPSYDKQILRDWLEATGWNKRPPPPALDPAMVEKTSARYLEFCQLLTGSLPEGVPG
ncbi:MAG TPA: phosphoribosylaminoimidazolesuccinocarboxamide synthase [Planctomycetota bacterium]|nr:phosphoribosylaminoimidazolesuccinocarboxamide synthase [Planctomycetota bacterium]